MKRIAVFLIFAALFSTAFSQNDLIIVGDNGIVQSFPLDNIRKLTFEEDYLQILLPAVYENIFYYDQFKYLTFDPKNISQNIDLQQDKNIDLFYNRLSDVLVIGSDMLIKRITIFDIQGRQIKKLSINNFYTSISLSNIPRGTYIVMTDTASGIISKKITK
ncbi:hypothetical protein FACS1894180_7490 [Bacteroidia bacterium]|nr:hypothetical protein FACS1894178_6590 [Bacteroidia bacterium]GHV45204.1 hypothetical protein FACS1894180_7490 [Bacteroidia bacterium]